MELHEVEFYVQDPGVTKRHGARCSIRLRPPNVSLVDRKAEGP